MKKQYNATWIILTLLVFLFLVGQLQQQTSTPPTNQFTQVPTPSYPEASQPRCGLATLSMLAAEVLNKKITPEQWGIKSTNELDEVETILNAWRKETGRKPVEVDKVIFGIPYFWTGKFQGGFHMCVCYYNSNSVTLKHAVYDPSTKTNYIVVWDYPTYFSNTVAAYYP